MRASSRPLAVLCPSSVRPWPYKIETTDDAARTGSAIHRVVAEAIGKIVDGETTVDDFVAEMSADISKVRGVDELEVATLARAAVSRFAQLLGKPRDGMWVSIEDPLQVLDETGSPDVSWYMDGEGIVEIVDWKFGREMRDHYHQLAQYAWLKRGEMRRDEEWKDGTKVICRIEYIRLKKSEVYEFSDAELDEWFVFVTDREGLEGEVFAPGSHCGFCRHADTCSAKVANERSATQALVDVKAGEVSLEVVGQAYDQYKLVKRAIANYERILEEALDSGASIPIGGGYELQRGTKPIESVRPREAWGILREAGFSDEDMAGIITIPKSGIEEVLRGRVKRGGLAGALRELLGKMRESGAIETEQRKAKIEVKVG